MGTDDEGAGWGVGRGPIDSLQPHRLTQKQYAQSKGWSKQYVHQLVKQGRIPLHDGLIDPIEANAALLRTRDPGRDSQVPAQVGEGRIRTPPVDPGASTPGPASTFVKARTVREHYRALKEKAEYEALMGSYIDARELRSVAFEVGRTFREMMYLNARRIAEALAGEFALDGAKVSSVARAETDRTLKETSASFAAPEFDVRPGLVEADEKIGASVT